MITETVIGVLFTEAAVMLWVDISGDFFTSAECYHQGINKS